MTSADSTVAVAVDPLGRGYGPGDVVAIAHCDSTFRENQFVYLLVEELPPGAVKGTVLGRTGPGASRSRTRQSTVYTHRHRVMALPGVTPSQVLASLSDHPSKGNSHG